MSAYFNEAIIIGDYHKRVEDISTKSGSVGVQVVMFYLNEYYDKSGTKQSRSEHILVTAWGKTGDLLASRLGPGDKMLVRGTLSGREYNGRYYLTFSANHVQEFGGHTSADSMPTPKAEKRSGTPEPVRETEEEETDLPF